jgi:flagella basal body P-ring formation protein FlgA
MATAVLRGDASAFIASHDLSSGNSVASADLTHELPVADGSALAPGSRANASHERRSSGHSAPGESGSAAQFRAGFLVTPGRLATLNIASSNMQMLLIVNPLERGAMGQKIRVKLSGSGKILEGQVTGLGQLEAKF